MNYIIAFISLCFAGISYADENPNYWESISRMTRGERALEYSQQSSTVALECGAGVLETFASGAVDSLQSSDERVRGMTVGDGIASFIGDASSYGPKDFRMSRSAYTATRNVYRHRLMDFDSKCQEAILNAKTIQDYRKAFLRASARAPAVNDQDRSTIREKGEAGRILARRNSATAK
jgi:hypothetical protein